MSAQPDEPLRIEVTDPREISVQHGEAVSSEASAPVVVMNQRGYTQAPARMPVDVATILEPDRAEEVGMGLIVQAYLARIGHGQEGQRGH